MLRGSRWTQKYECNIPHHLPRQKVRTAGCSLPVLPALVHGAAVDGGDPVGGGDGGGGGGDGGGGSCDDVQSVGVTYKQKCLHQSVNQSVVVYTEGVQK